MTVIYTADVFCDRCGNWFHGDTGFTASGLATKVVRRAKAAGWSRVNNSQWLDLCPVCVIESRKEGSNHV